MEIKPIEYYTSRESTLRDELTNAEKNKSQLYAARVITFVLFAIAVTFTIYREQSVVIAIIAAVVMFGLFITIAIRDLKNSAKIEELKNRIKFIQGEIKALHHDTAERDNGAEFSELNRQLSGDFDIFGDGSLYQYLNRSVTHRGKSRAAAALVACELRPSEIERRAAAIAELSKMSRFLEDFSTIGGSISESGDEVQNLLKWIEEPTPKERAINILRFVMPAITIPAIVLAAFMVIPMSVVSIPIIISLIIIQSSTKKLNQAHALLGHSAKIFDKYSSLVSLIEQQEFTSTLLNASKEKLAAEHSTASQSIAALKSLLNRFDYRFNIYVSFALNSTLLFDLHTYMSLLRWKREHKEHIEKWFDAVTEVDALLGLAIYAYNCAEQTTYATTSESSFLLSAKEMGHPLINPEVRVNNSIEISGRAAGVIITGANMAGKSTFLRSIAANLILAMNGAPVPAKEFKFTPVKILSSIKIQDSLKNRESYFYAELLRLSHILESIEQQPQSIIILDEILRGTNTKDKQQGSSGLLRKIIDKRGVVIIATHDLVIGELENEYPDCVTNYCFEVEIEADQLSFDYKLKRGISSKLNASFLMRQMGIID